MNEEQARSSSRQDGEGEAKEVLQEGTAPQNGKIEGGKRKAAGRPRCTKYGRGGTADRSARSAEYKAWSDAKGRCVNSLHRAYKNYGARGILMCKRWLYSFDNFLDDMGRRPSPKHSIDRFPNNNGNYDPGNCRWATTQEQQRNRRNNVQLTYEGKTKTATEWAMELGISVAALYNRRKRFTTIRQILAPRNYFRTRTSPKQHT